MDVKLSKAIKLLNNYRVCSVDEQSRNIKLIDEAMIYVFENGTEKQFCNVSDGVVLTPKQLWVFIKGVQK